MVRARRLDDVPAPGPVDPLIGRIRTACGRLLDALERPRNLLDGVLGTDQPPAMIADRAAAAFLPDAALRQELLEMVVVELRLQRERAELEELVDELT